MRITEIRELSVPLQGNIANALVNFSEHTVSLVAVYTDVWRGGRPLVGLAFNSIGRYAQGGLLRERFIPRLLAAEAGALLDEGGSAFDPARALRLMLRNEKPGGHGDRAAAVAALELALWDLNAKLRDEPACVTIARHFGRAPAADMEVYAAGGYYYPRDSTGRLADELRGLREQGVTMILTSHILAELQERVDRLAIMASGQVRACGTVHALREQVDMPVRIDVRCAPDQEQITAQAVQQALAQTLFQTAPEFAMPGRITVQALAEGGLQLRCPRQAKLGVLAALTSVGSVVHDLQVIEPSLEDVFFGFAD